MSQYQMFWMLIATQLIAKCTHAGSLFFSPPTLIPREEVPWNVSILPLALRLSIVLPYIPFQSFEILFTVVSLVIIIW
jgi:hypothetical protein